MFPFLHTWCRALHWMPQLSPLTGRCVGEIECRFFVQIVLFSTARVKKAKTILFERGGSSSDIVKPGVLLPCASRPMFGNEMDRTKDPVNEKR